jgi:RNA polymerase sigma factor (sigma-70 family)
MLGPPDGLTTDGQEEGAMDVDLVIRAQRGDQQAFEALALQSHTRLQAVAVGILRDPHLAEDAVQQAMLGIWRDIGGLHDPAKFEGWSYRLLVRICHAEAKRKRARQLDIPAEMAAEPVAADAYGVVIRRDQLERAFEHLSMDQRTVIVLHYLMDMTLDQVAESLDIPPGTAYSRISRAMDAMRAAIEADARPANVSTVRQEVRR